MIVHPPLRNLKHSEAFQMLAMVQELGGHRTSTASWNNSEILNIDWRAHWHGWRNQSVQSLHPRIPCGAILRPGVDHGHAFAGSSILLQSVAPNESTVPEIKLGKPYRWARNVCSRE